VKLQKAGIIMLLRGIVVDAAIEKLTGGAVQFGQSGGAFPRAVLANIGASLTKLSKSG